LRIALMDLRFVVLHPGARMHYAVPALLARAGMLARLYTDICASVGATRLLQAVWPEKLQPRPVARLLGRRLPEEVPITAVCHAPVHAIVHRAMQHIPLAGDSLGRRYDPSRHMMNLVRRDAFAEANALYTVLVNEDLDLVREARARGIKIVHEAMIGPDVGWWFHREQLRYPEMGPVLEQEEEIREGNRLDALKYQLSDLILVPSAFTRDSVIALGAAPERVVTVPYGLDQRWLDEETRPAPGRVLFVGSVGLRKGSHYLAEAARILQSRRVACEVRVVGPCDRGLVARREFRGPTYVGQVPRSRVIEEFRQADVFVLPTLCEGMATAHLEALACGVPVITTPNCGSVVRDGLEGFIVPIRDAAALAERIEHLITDRELRERMSHNARARAREFTWERYGERLLEAFRRL
jgi:glycosyltransferase involved in cell wall biosynthesis